MTAYIEILKSKIHGAVITETKLHYVGSITIDEALIEASDMLVGEKVQIVNNNNGERFETYIIRGERNSGVICLNGAAARKAQVGDNIIIISYMSVLKEEAINYEPIVVFPKKFNAL